MHICNYCNKKFDTFRGMRIHESMCDANPLLSDKHNVHGMYQCRHCGTEFISISKLRGHLNRCNSNPNYIRNICNYKIGHTKNIGRHHTQETRNKISKSHIKHALTNPAEYQSKHGNYRTVFYYYDNIRFDSSWELIVYLWYKLHNITIVKSPYSYVYEFGGKQHVYIPDFYLPDTDEILEVKGWETDRDLIKYASVDRTLIVIKHDDVISMNAYNKMHINDYDISQYNNKPRKISLTKIRKVLNEFNEVEKLKYAFLFSGINFSKFGCVTQLANFMHLSSPQVTGRWLRKTRLYTFVHQWFCIIIGLLRCVILLG